MTAAKGETQVEAMIKKYGTNNAWELERLEPREHYLPDVMAVMILLKNPEWLD